MLAGNIRLQVAPIGHAAGQRKPRPAQTNRSGQPSHGLARSQSPAARRPDSALARQPNAPSQAANPNQGMRIGKNMKIEIKTRMNQTTRERAQGAGHQHRAFA